MTTEHDEIHAVALDYIEGWFEGNASRMRRALSPDRRKCSISTDPKSGKVMVCQPNNNAFRMVRLTELGIMKENNVKVDVEVLYVFRDIAAARTTCPYFEDLLHLANFGDYGWRIVNAIWQVTEGEWSPSAEEELEQLMA